MNCLIPAATLALASLLNVAQAGAEETTYRGFCDASAAVALDAKHFVVANDDRHALTIYELGNPKSIKCVELIEGSQECAKPTGTKTDIEGAARIGDRIYWISSHAGTKTKRQQFFATDVLQKDSGATVSTAKLANAGFSAALKTKITEIREVDLEKWGGLNIEGLAATGQHLLIGFRNPLDKAEHALLLDLANPAEVIDKGDVPAFGRLYRLDLGGRGIRSIERIGSQFVIVAGPPEGDPKNKRFALYTLPETGLAGKDDHVIKPGRYKGNDFSKRVSPAGDMHPEAVFATGRDNEVYLISDDGKNCKKGDESFRGFALTLPAANQNR